jgi:hypothetical protein
VSCNLKEKSLTTHRNDGKYLATSSGSDSPITSDFICSSFDKSILTIDELLLAYN